MLFLVLFSAFCLVIQVLDVLDLTLDVKSSSSLHSFTFKNPPTLLIWSSIYLCELSDASAKCSTVTSLLTENNISLLRPVHAKARAAS